MNRQVVIHLTSLLLFIIMVLGIASYLFGIDLDLNLYKNKPVYSAGANSTTITASFNTTHARQMGFDVAIYSWNQIMETDTAPWSQNGSYAISLLHSAGVGYAYYSQFMAFDLSSLDGTDITAVTLKAHLTSSALAGQEFEWANQYLSFYLWENDNLFLEETDYGTSYNQGSYKPGRSINLYWVYYWNLEGDYWWEIDFGDNAVDDLLSMVDDNGFLWVEMAFTARHNGGAPTSSAGINFVTCTSGAGANAPKLEIDYIDNRITRETKKYTNGAVHPASTGNETADNITWVSPRCAFSDELLVWAVYGDYGANITLRAVDEHGTLIDSKTDSIRDNGFFCWDVDPPESFSGWVRCYEDNNSLKSTWGRVEPYPPDSSEPLTVFAEDMTYPQYNYGIEKYYVYKNGLMYIFWETNVTTGEFSSYYLSVLKNGRVSVSPIWQMTFQNLNDNYFEPEYSENDYLTAVRYIIASPKVDQAGFNTYDGLVVNMVTDYSLGSSGFIPAIVWDGSNPAIAECHSAYWYIKQSSVVEGLDIRLGNTPRTNRDVECIIEVGQYSRVGDYLSNIQIDFIDNSGSVINSVSGAVDYGVNKIDIVAPDTSGDYEIRFTLYDDTNSPYYSYVYDLPCHVYSIGEDEDEEMEADPSVIIDNFGEKIEEMLGRFGLNNTAGRWLVILVLMAIFFIIFYKSKLLRVLVPCLVLGFGFLMEWMEQWLVILIVMFVGLGLWGLINYFMNRRGQGTD